MKEKGTQVPFFYLSISLESQKLYDTL